MATVAGGYRSRDFGNGSHFNEGGRNHEPRSGGGHNKRRQTDEELYDAWTRVYAEVEANPDAFNIWEDLVEAAEALEGGLCKASTPRAFQLLRFTFDFFLKRFPFAHGYWIKYAELEFRLGFTENAELVYIRAVSEMPASVEVWTAYCSFKLLTSPNADAVRATFESAVEQVGLHYLAHPVWDKYIEFEEREMDHLRLFKLYDRIIRIPLHQYARYFATFMELCPTIPVEHLVEPLYLDQFRAEYEIDKAERNQEEQQQEQTAVATKDEAEEEADLRLRIANYHVQIYVSTQNEVAARWQYETNILRSFFHVVYLAEEELVNWRRYLHFEEVEGNTDRIILLYERAVLPTAQYEEFWLRYARWLVASDLIEQARRVLQQGCFAVPIGRTELRIYYAQFEEAQGNYEAAKDIYNIILETLPNCTQAIVGLANLLRCQESTSAALTFLQAQTKSLVAAGLLEDAALLTTTEANIQLYSREGGVDAARLAYTSAASQFLDSYHFWREYLRFEINESALSTASTSAAADNSKAHETVESVYNQIKTMAHLTPVQLKDLGHIYMVYLLDSDRLGSERATQAYFALDGEVHKGTYV